jgi:DNA-binding NarL/FixJ family response regulator
MSHRRLLSVRRNCLGPSREIIERARARRVGVVSTVAEALDGVELTRRQEQTLKLLLRGKSEKQVAAAMGLSRNTVHLYVTGIYRRLGVHSRTELLMRCLGRPRGGEAMNGSGTGNGNGKGNGGAG